MKMTTQGTQRRKGFALVIVLSLMTFILFLLLGISTLVQVESQSAEINLSHLEAEQNALLGLQLALGELQAAMGPDQRVSANADIFSNVTALGRGKAVGVWDSAKGINEGDLVKWLASDARRVDGTVRQDYNQDSIAPTYPVVMVGAGSLDGDGDGFVDTPEDRVIVDAATTIIEQAGQEVGRYAWWVADEGVKARINLSGGEQVSTSAKFAAVLEAGNMSKANASVLSNLETIDFETNAPRLLNLASVDLLDGNSNAAVAEGYFHDLTTHSTGVLADVRNGGLKKDLSLAFEMSDVDFNSSEFGSGGSRTINAPGFGVVQPTFWVSDAHGPVWHLLRDYYRLYHLMETPMTNPTIDARVFGPNLNHGDNALRSPGNLSSSGLEMDEQPAVLFAGGKAKFTLQVTENHHLFINGDKITNDADAFPNTDTAPIDMAMLESDSIRLGTVGDPLRGGGQAASGTTMPVMVTGNYLPYMLRFIAEIGMYFNESYTGPFKSENSDMVINNPVSISQVNRQRFVMHNPYNVTLRHNEIALDSFGCDTAFHLTQGGNLKRILTQTNTGYKDFRQQKQWESSRQARIPSGEFAPGKIKIFNAAKYGRNPSDTVSYASEGTDPDWLFYSKANPKPTGFIEKPINENGDDAYTMYIFGNSGDLGLHLQASWENDLRYSLSQQVFITHLKQSGNEDFDGRPIRDAWPMASIIDTGIFLPGPDNVISGQSFGSGKTPGALKRFFPNSTNDTLYITPQVIAIYNSANNPFPVATFDLQLKSTEFGRSETRYQAFARTNPLAPVRDNKNLFPADDFIQNSVGFPTLSPDLDITMSDDGIGGFASNLDYWGPSNGSIINTTRGVKNPVLLELPTAPVLSMGKFQHANLGVHAHMPALAVGNSLASPYVDSTKTINYFENRYKQSRAFYDLSYLMNEVLWDGYFLSSYSLPYDVENDDFNEVDTHVSSTFDAFAGNSNSLPNPRMRLLPYGTESIRDIRDKLFNGNRIEPEGYQRAAENLLVAGSFNVNSTSVEAWRAVLSGARDFAIYQSGEVAPTQPSVGATPFSRLSQPVSGESDGTDSTAPTTWSGFRALSDSEINSLAVAIVDELKIRVAAKGHPYLSIADFINRELSAGASGRVGLLQAAIDKAGFNTDLKSGSAAITQASLEATATGVFPFASNILQADGSSASANQAAPTYLMQADILQAIGSFINVRSDTFRIRSYGESKDMLTGEVHSKVFIEAIVQRLPVPATPDSVATPDSIKFWNVHDSSGKPLPFGRRFKILSIRQLPIEEV